MPNDYYQMPSDANYPSDNGITLGFSSTVTTSLPGPMLMNVDLAVGGTPGSSPTYQIQVKDSGGSWVNATGLSLTAAGQVSGTVEGTAVRLSAANGTSPGTGNNTPKYWLEVQRVPLATTGDYTG